MLRNDDQKLFELVYKQRQHNQRFPQETSLSIEEKYEKRFEAQERLKEETKGLIEKWAPVLEKLPDDGS